MTFEEFDDLKVGDVVMPNQGLYRGCVFKVGRIEGRMVQCLSSGTFLGSWIHMQELDKVDLGQEIRKLWNKLTEKKGEQTKQALTDEQFNTVEQVVRDFLFRQGDAGVEQKVRKALKMSCYEHALEWGCDEDKARQFGESLEESYLKDVIDEE